MWLLKSRWKNYLIFLLLLQNTHSLMDSTVRLIGDISDILTSQMYHIYVELHHTVAVINSVPCLTTMGKITLLHNEQKCLYKSFR